MGRPRTDRAGRDAASRHLDRLFHALSDAKRRAILLRLTLGPARVTDLAAPFDISLPAISTHLRVLEEAGLVHRSVDGRVHRLSLSARRLIEVEEWLDPFRAYWRTTFEALDRDLLERPRRRPARPPGRSPQARHRVR